MPLELEFVTGEVKTLALPVKMTRSTLGPNHPEADTLDSWSLMKETGKEYPVGVARFNPPSAVIGSYDFILPLNTCDQFGQRSRLFIDVDGRGFVELERPYGKGIFDGGLSVGMSQNPHSPALGGEWANIPLPPEARIIRFRAEADGQTLGPFSYRFDPLSLVTKAAKGINPDVTCGGPWTPRSCFAEEKLGLFDVAKVRFGAEPEAFTHEYDVSFSAKEYLSFCDEKHRSTSCRPFHFEVPAGWADVYFEVIMKDGSVGNTGRLRL